MQIRGGTGWMDVLIAKRKIGDDRHTVRRETHLEGHINQVRLYSQREQVFKQKFMLIRGGTGTD